MADSVDNKNFLNEIQRERELCDMDIKQEFVECEKIWDNTEILIPSVIKNNGSIFEELNYNTLKYKTNDLSSPKDNKEINENYEKNEEIPFKVEESIYIKKEIIEDLMIKNEPDSIHTGTHSEKFCNSNPYYLTGVESSDSIGNTVLGENRLEDICVKKEITEELILKDESDFIQIETQENTESKQLPDSKKYYLIVVESVSGPCGVNKTDIEPTLKRLIGEIDILQNKQLNIDKSTYISENRYPCDVNKNSFACDICKKIFKHKSSLKTHKRIHTGEKPYACDVCKETFNHKYKLNEHLLFHSGDKPYECDVCKNLFYQKFRLDRHKCLHTSEKSYACDVCKKTFNFKGRLNSHEKVHWFQSYKSKRTSSVSN